MNIGLFNYGDHEAIMFMGLFVNTAHASQHIGTSQCIVKPILKFEKQYAYVNPRRINCDLSTARNYYAYIAIGKPINFTGQ